MNITCLTKEPLHVTKSATPPLFSLILKARTQFDVELQQQKVDEKCGNSILGPRDVSEVLRSTEYFCLSFQVILGVQVGLSIFIDCILRDPMKFVSKLIFPCFFL